MDSTENKSGVRITGQESESGVDTPDQSNTNSSKSAEIINSEEFVKPKWAHNQKVSNNQMMELLTILKESVEGSIKQTEDQIKNYREVLKNFKP